MSDWECWGKPLPGSADRRRRMGPRVEGREAVMPNGNLMRHEIHEQPAVIERLLSSQRPAATDLVQHLARRQISQVVIAARGTSDNAGRYAQYLLGGMNGLVVALATPSLFTLYRRPPRLAKALVLGISQSGRSPDIIAVLAEARRQGALTAVMTNETGSELAAQADVVLDLCAGEERAVAATKTYTAELAAIALLSAILSDEREMAEALGRLPQAVSEALQLEEASAEAAAQLREMRAAVVIGRGFNYSTAFELALKIKELTYTSTEAYSSADFRHGPLALVQPGFPVIGIAASGPRLPDMLALLEAVKERQADITWISDDPQPASVHGRALVVPRHVPEWLTPIPLIVPGQLLAFHLALARGYDVDAPRSITKITETYYSEPGSRRKLPIVQCQ